MVRELFYIPYILVPIPGLIFVIGNLPLYLCLPVQVLSPKFRCHLLILSTYFKNYLSTA